MSSGYLLVSKSGALHGQVELHGAKNAVLVIMASLLLTKGISQLANVPDSADVRNMITLLTDLGAQITFDAQTKKLTVDTRHVNRYAINSDIMGKMRASILVMGPLLAHFGKAQVTMPGGCVLGTRPINLHLSGFARMGVSIHQEGNLISAQTNSTQQTYARVAFDYPSVGATENILMFATLRPGQTDIINAALEPEVLDLIDILKAMGANIQVGPGAVLHIEGVTTLNSVQHTIIPDRLEAGALLLAASVTGGSITLPQARADHMDIFLEKLREMGHLVQTNLEQGSCNGITLQACQRPKGVHVKTGPYPGFPTDLQAPMMAALCLASGSSVIEETVFENRLLHARELAKMGAQIRVQGCTATVHGVDELYGAHVIATDIRASCALVLAGMAAHGTTHIAGVSHWQRGYDQLEHKLSHLGAQVKVLYE